MAVPVTTVASGGLPITIAANGLPMTEAINATPVTIAANGLPVTMVALAATTGSGQQSGGGSIFINTDGVSRQAFAFDTMFNL